MYILLSIIVVVSLLLAVRIRLRMEFTPDQRWLFAGLGRTGIRYDFSSADTTILWCGIPIRKRRHRKIKSVDADQKSKDKAKAVSRKKLRSGGRRERSKRQIAWVVKHSIPALWKYSIGLLHSIIVEQLEARVAGGFDSPHLTGQVFGYYQAALATAPAVVGRVQYDPDFTGASISGTVKASVALPLHQLLLRTVILVAELPLREIVRLAIGKKKGDLDV